MVYWAGRLPSHRCPPTLLFSVVNMDRYEQKATTNHPRVTFRSARFRCERRGINYSPGTALLTFGTLLAYTGAGDMTYWHAVNVNEEYEISFTRRMESFVWGDTLIYTYHIKNWSAFGYKNERPLQGETILINFRIRTNFLINLLAILNQESLECITIMWSYPYPIICCSSLTEYSTVSINDLLYCVRKDFQGNFFYHEHSSRMKHFVHLEKHHIQIRLTCITSKNFCHHYPMKNARVFLLKPGVNKLEKTVFVSKRGTPVTIKKIHDTTVTWPLIYDAVMYRVHFTYL